MAQLGLRRDPVHAACRRAASAFTWDRIGALVSLGAGDRELLSRGRRFGVAPGLTVPLHIPGEPPASCSFTAPLGVRPGRHNRLAAESVALHAFAAARRLVSRAPPPHLSRRELECVRLIARGKSDWEIAAILGLSAETVRGYVKRARLAYDVVSRTQLVVRALHDGLIGFPPQSPQSGG